MRPILCLPVVFSLATIVANAQICQVVQLLPFNPVSATVPPLNPQESGRPIQMQEYWQRKAEEIKGVTPNLARRLIIDGFKLKAQGEYGRAVVGFLGPGATASVEADKNPTLKGAVTLVWDIPLSALLPDHSARKLKEAESNGARAGRERERTNKMIQLQIQFQQARAQFERLSQLLSRKDKGCTDEPLKKELIENFHIARQAAISFLELKGEDPELVNLWIKLDGPFRTGGLASSTQESAQKSARSRSN